MIFMDLVLKDNHREKKPWNKLTQALKKNMNMDIWPVGTSIQLFIRGSYIEIKIFKKIK